MLKSDWFSYIIRLHKKKIANTLGSRHDWCERYRWHLVLSTCSATIKKVVRPLFDNIWQNITSIVDKTILWKMRCNLFPPWPVIWRKFRFLYFRLSCLAALYLYLLLKLFGHMYYKRIWSFSVLLRQASLKNIIIRFYWPTAALQFHYSNCPDYWF